MARIESSQAETTKRQALVARLRGGADRAKPDAASETGQAQPSIQPRLSDVSEFSDPIVHVADDPEVRDYVAGRQNRRPDDEDSTIDDYLDAPDDYFTHATEQDYVGSAW